MSNENSTYSQVNAQSDFQKPQIHQKYVTNQIQNGFKFQSSNDFWKKKEIQHH